MDKQIGKHLKNKINIVIMVALVVITFLLTLFITTNINKAIPVMAEKKVVDVKVIEEKLRSMAELSTLTYEYSDVGVLSDQKTLSMFGNEFGIVGTKKSFIITYDGEMKFGIDLSEIEISEYNNTLTVKLPPTEMFSHEMKEESISLLDEKSGLFTSFSMTDYADFMVQQKDKMENRAVEKDLYLKAKLNAEVQIESFISAIPEVS